MLAKYALGEKLQLLWDFVTQATTGACSRPHALTP